MWKAQEQVREFMRDVAEQPTPKKLDTITGRESKNLRITLMAEELAELERALEHDDLIDIADGLCDLLYVVIGTAVAYGMDIEPLFNEVQRSNMTKKGGPLSPLGKRLKTDNYSPPNLSPILSRML